jgi:hypothetical protein
MRSLASPCEGVNPVLGQGAYWMGYRVPIWPDEGPPIRYARCTGRDRNSWRKSDSSNGQPRIGCALRSSVFVLTSPRKKCTGSPEAHGPPRYALLSCVRRNSATVDWSAENRYDATVIMV